MSARLPTCIVLTGDTRREIITVAVEPPRADFPERRFDDLDRAFAFAEQLSAQQGWSVFDLIDPPPAAA